MDSNTSVSRIHPLVAAAAVSVILVSLVGVAAITGLLPDSHSNAAPTAALSAPDTKATQDTNPANELADKAPSKEDNSAPAKPVASVTQKPASTSRPAKTSQAQRIAQAAPVAPPVCNSCGRVESVLAVRGEAPGSGVGAVAGGVVGGLLGNQVGGGSGRTLATVAGAVGGGFAGNAIEKRMKTTYQVRVRMDNGAIRNFPYNNQPNWQAGDRIRVVDGYLTARG
jgi:outer membrane lipoprotein SlyB